jgi:hypothetical protein
VQHEDEHTEKDRASPSSVAHVPEIGFKEPTTFASAFWSWFSAPRRFTNWGHTVDRVMRHIHTPVCVADVQRFVREAAAEGRRVRATGYQHTWADFYPDADQVLLTMLPDRLVR